MKQTIKRTFLWIGMAACLAEGFSQNAPSPEKNYILTRTPRTEAAAIGGLSDCMTAVEYFDEWGRPMQHVQMNASPLFEDWVTYKEYDLMGNPYIEWLPVPVPDNNSRFVSPVDVVDYSCSFYQDDYGYSQKYYEQSPLRRIEKDYAAGVNWIGDDYGKVYSYGMNAIEIPRYTVMPTTGDTTVTVTMQDKYAVGELLYDEVLDEEQNKIRYYKDRRGLTVLEEKAGNYRTFYVYDDRDRLCAVLPPELSASMTTVGGSWSNEDASLRNHAYLYIYNGQNRCTRKRLPGTSWVFYYYDRSGQLILTQDGNRRANGECTFTIPDRQGRMVLTGICKNSCPVSENPLANVYVRAERNTGMADFMGYDVNGISLVFPQIESVSYYDDYTFLNSIFPVEIATQVGYTAESGYGERYTDTPIGWMTGSVIRVSDGSFLYGTFYYDRRDRLIQTHETNMLGGVESGYHAYNFVGEPIQKKLVHSAPGQISQTEIYEYGYDHQGRLIDIRHRLNGQNSILLCTYTYDRIGRMVSKKFHNQEALTQAYDYNIRSWVRGISGNLFSQDIYYVDDDKGCPFSTTYTNGNIAGISWRTGNESTMRHYEFEYDGLNRMTSAYYTEGEGMNLNPDGYTEKVTGYDKNGNILSLQRYGNGLIDNLTYTYNGNQLTKVEDATGNTAGFKNGVSQANEYTYDNNGNLTKDSNKGIASITYNSLNLPQVATFSNGNTITYLYTADGKKLRTVHKIGTTTTTTDYCGNVIYENGTQKLLLTEEGYINLNSPTTYYYYLKDHQGNNRVVVNSSGTVQEVNHYYPFGSTFATSNVQPYKYNGKELDTANGLNWYDYGARHYDATLGRWHVVDPLAEKHYSNSSYTYCLNNPLLYIDPLGKDTVLVQDINIRPNDRGIKGETYTAIIEFIKNGETVGTYRGSSYPNSESNSNNNPRWNTVREGEYNYNNQYGHNKSSEKGLNIINENNERFVPGITPQNEDVIMEYVNVHAGRSDNGNFNSRGSKGCITIHPDDAPAFFSNFHWNSLNPYIGTSKGKIIIKRNINKE